MENSKSAGIVLGCAWGVRVQYNARIERGGYNGLRRDARRFVERQALQVYAADIPGKTCAAGRRRNVSMNAKQAVMWGSTRRDVRAGTTRRRTQWDFERTVFELHNE